MSARVVAAFALTGLALFSSVPAQAADGIFGDFLSRFSSPDQPQNTRATEVQNREREARNMRREYWGRERSRVSASPSIQGSLAREISGPAVSAR